MKGGIITQNLNFAKVKEKITPKNIFQVLFCLSIIGIITELSFSVTTIYSKIIFCVMIISLIVSIVFDVKNDKEELLLRIREYISSSRWLFIALLAYFAFDIITMFYTKNVYLALKKLPYMLYYIGIFLAGIYFCRNKKTLYFVMGSISIAGTIVAVCSIIYYFCVKNPIYYQRISTARDYNVFACLILIPFIFSMEILLNYSKLKFGIRISIFIGTLLFCVPAFYFAGSRRMLIMLPYLFAFAFMYEFIRLAFKKKIKGEPTIVQNLIFFSALFTIYIVTVFALPYFSDYGIKKEIAYKQYIAEQRQDNPDKPPEVDVSDTEKTISDVIETIDDKSMFSKRELIYAVAVDELKDSSIPELIFGRGSAYDIHMYDITNNKPLLEAYNISEKNPRPAGWLSVHNFMLADMLNGGLIKLLLGMFLIVQIIIHIIKAIKLKQRSGIMLIIPIAIVLINNFISMPYGLLNDAFFHLMMIVLTGIIYVERKVPIEILTYNSNGKVEE